MKVLYIAAATLAAVAYIGLLIYLARAAGRAQLRARALSRQLAAANRAITQIEEQADTWRDIDSVLAAAARNIIRTYRTTTTPTLEKVS